ncbi:MAG: DUF86 domain-containing protein [Saprospiraceae bacterium]|nr:DUF86 domain-containing protein [Saprospiraceae bacterium]
MPSLSEKDRDSLELLLEVVEKIQLVGKDMDTPHDLEANFVYQDAILMNFILIGECIKRLSKQFKDSKPEVELSGKKLKIFETKSHMTIGVLMLK